MSWDAALLLYGVVLLGCLLAGVEIGVALGLVGVLGVTLASGTRLWLTFGNIIWNTTTNFNLLAIPLFVLMGEIILRSGMSERFYAGVSYFLRRVPGGLAHTNIAGCAVFSALTGSSVTTAMTVGTVALPEMRKRGYHDHLILGSLAGGGCLGILIPPSIPMIVYASITQVSVLDLFMAGMLPGILLALMFFCYVGARVLLSPGLGGQKEEAVSVEKSSVRYTLDTIPVIGLIVAVIAGMYFGVVTPTEAAGFGSAVALLVASFYKGFQISSLWIALQNSVVTSCVIMFITINAQFLSFAVVQSGIANGISSMLVGSHLSPFYFFCALVVLYAVIGMFLDGLSILLLTVPILYPGLSALGFNGVWLGVIIVILIELGALTPPMGLNLFAIQSIARDRSLGDVGRASVPYAVMIVCLCFMLYAFPSIALSLPNIMGH